MGRTALMPLLVLAVGYLGLCLAAYLFQTRLIYFPGPPPGRTPADAGLEFRELELATSDGVRLHAWLLEARAPRGVVLVCHGNAGSIEQRIEHGSAFVSMGWSVLLFDYRGYGRSTGSPSEEGTYRDAEAAYDWLVGAGGQSGARIVVYGESLGAGVAIELARRRPVDGVVAESAFTSLADLGAEVYPILPVRWLVRHRYRNLEKVAALRVPLLVIHSPQDEIVPVAHGTRLFEAAREPRSLLLTEGGHNDGGFLRRAEWRGAVRVFLERPREGAPAVH